MLQVRVQLMTVIFRGLLIWQIELRLGTVELPVGGIISQSSLMGGVESPEPEPGPANFHNPFPPAHLPDALASAHSVLRPSFSPHATFPRASLLWPLPWLLLRNSNTATTSNHLRVRDSENFLRRIEDFFRDYYYYFLIRMVSLRNHNPRRWWYLYDGGRQT